MGNLLCNFAHVDINECTMSSNPCDQNCTNNNGSFVCSCTNGYVLDDDQRSCDGKCVSPNKEMC